MVTSSDAWRLRLGAFDFSPGAHGGCDVRLVTFRRGRPVPVTQVVASGIEDGAIEQVVRHDNRDQVLVVGFKAADAQILAEVEQELLLECAKARNSLAWTPPDGFGATSVYDVTLADPEFLDGDGWDLDELRGYRQWQITFRSLSFARAETLTTIAALVSGVTPASTTIADGTSATNWTGTTTVTASGGTLRQTVTTSTSTYPGATSYTGESEFIYTPASPLTAFATKRYLYVDVTFPSGGYAADAVGVWMSADGVEVEPIAGTVLPSGAQRLWFACDDASVSILKIRIRWANHYLTGTGSMPTALHQIDNVTATNQAPSTPASPGREALRTIAVPGSARTPASLAIEHATLGLGVVLIHSHPALAVGGYSPDLRRLRVSGSAETGGATISGLYSAVDDVTPEVFRIPTAALPRGGFLLLARPYSTSVFDDVQVTVSTRLSTGALIGTRTTRNRNVQTVAGFAVLADLTLPVADVPSSSNATVELSVLTFAATSPIYDEMFLCALGDDASLTLVDCGADTAATLGTANNRLWVDSASLDRPSPAIWLGTAVDKSDAYFAGGAVGAWMPHAMVPPLMTLFVANSGGANPTIAATLYERAHTHIVAGSA